MKTSLLAAAAALLMATAAPVSAEDLMISGYWRAYRNVVGDKPTCGVSTSTADGGTFMIKYFYGDTYLTGHVMKRSWRFPSDGTYINIPLTVGVDRNPILRGNAIGYTQFVSPEDGVRQPLPTLEFSITPQKTSIDQFLDDFSLAAKFWLRFDEGSEKPWVLDMTGSAKVTLVFKACALELIRLSKGNDSLTSQPYGQPRATQPYGQSQPTQPYSNRSEEAPPQQPQDQSRAPTPKTVKTKPVRRDDGSI
ncbi:hypothetical protein [Bradyrhizobium sp. UFLA05-112]